MALPEVRRSLNNSEIKDRLTSFLMVLFKSNGQKEGRLAARQIVSLGNSIKVERRPEAVLTSTNPTKISIYDDAKDQRSWTFVIPERS
ncbi:hypothetical protein M0802_005215 [Mischocyttarus mexicanus]|nr:hypothetical protein M0802_005215 [Mischocyttarus mexicanus]